ncbi:porin [Halomonas heilongjiangensis]|uniref:Porin domain-containing protein n=1 Tax=Halomonas heilongjiangensis TaxID=1387883 RepID=A0A2N7TLF3_9GAMM|nr:porin [Halomonas heilongjiangensis]PMR69009.1 hypothetical protein C1H66_12910 [Halomonas heilongjiangensis]PXX90033.1 hypothetical protein CR158_09490 [Halomonas heilongjiangensis]
MRPITPLGFSLATLLVATSYAAQADIVLYDRDDTTFSADGYINAFYVNTEVDSADPAGDRRQSRVKMGFLPNWIGFNASRHVGSLELGARSSFWMTINDSDDNGTETGIDVRQFHGTIGGDWGEVLVGKDFGLFARSNIFLDQLLSGYGQVSDTLERRYEKAPRFESELTWEAALGDVELFSWLNGVSAPIGPLQNA